MIIFNESRLGGSRVTAAYLKPRPCSATLAIRYQVRRTLALPYGSCHRTPSQSTLCPTGELWRSLLWQRRYQLQRFFRYTSCRLGPASLA